MELSGKKVAVFVATDYEDLEAWYPVLRLKEAGANVAIIRSDAEPETCLSKHGYPIKTDLKAMDAKAEYDAVVIPGGWAPDRLRRCQNTLRIVRDTMNAGKVVATICHGGWVLASADILQGKKLTATEAIKDDLVNAGADWTDSEVVVDGNLITSRRPGDLPAFMREIIKALE